MPARMRGRRGVTGRAPHGGGKRCRHCGKRGKGRGLGRLSVAEENRAVAAGGAAGKAAWSARPRPTQAAQHDTNHPPKRGEGAWMRS